MKTLKKLSCIALILVLALGLMTTAFAANINIQTKIPEGGTEAETYTAYKVFDVVIGGTGIPTNESDPANTNPHSYSISSKIGETDTDNPFFAVVLASGYFTLEQIGETGVYNVKANDNYDAAAAADLTTKLLAAVNGDVPVVATTDTHTDADADGKVTYTLPVGGAGYYLITSTLGSKMIVDTVGAGDITIQAKNEYPSLTKKVLDGKEYGESTTASYGETVTFKIDVKIPETAVGAIVVHDTMDPQLSYGNLTTDSFPVSDVSAGLTDGCTMEFTISPEQVAANKVGAGDDTGTVTIIYTATLNADAKTGTAIVNEAYLTYSKYTSKPDDAMVYTYEFDLFKTNSENVPLAGATFSLGMKLVDLGNNTYRVAVADDETTVTEFTTDATGKILIKGLANGTYTLTEVSAPKGYNKLKAPVEVVIADANNIVTEDAEAENGYTGTHIVNLTGAELPSTGGIGTTIFYIVGGLLVVGACVLLVTRKRVND